MKKSILIIIILVFVFSGLSQNVAFAASNAPEIIGESAILIDAKNGTVLYAKDEDALKEPASTTKMMTCLLALENLRLDQIVTIDAETPFTEGSRVYLIEGEQITVEHLIYALMLESANDAAVALAKEISGSVEEFAVLMNKRAKEMGAKNTTFINPNGLHLEGHNTTAYDLAMIAKTAMQNPEFRKFVSTYAYTIPATNKQPERFPYNTNRLLYDELTKVPVRGIMTPAKYEGVTGIKTGYTSHAGGCLVAGAERNGMELIAVTLKSTDPGRFGDCIAMLDYGFENYYSHKAVDASTAIEDVKVRRGKFNHVAAMIKEDRYLTLPKEASTSLITTKIVMDPSVTAPVKKGQQIGKIEIYEGSNVVGEVPVMAANAIKKGGLLSVYGIEDSVGAVIKKVVLTIVCTAVFFFLLILILRIRYVRRRNARRKRRAHEIAKARERKQRDLEQRRWPY